MIVHSQRSPHATTRALLLRSLVFRYHVLHLDSEKDTFRARENEIELSANDLEIAGCWRAKPPLYLDSKVRAQRASCYDINCRLSRGNYLSLSLSLSVYTRRAINRDSRLCYTLYKLDPLAKYVYTRNPLMKYTRFLASS